MLRLSGAVEYRYEQDDNHALLLVNVIHWQIPPVEIENSSEINEETAHANQ